MIRPRAMAALPPRYVCPTPALSLSGCTTQSCLPIPPYSATFPHRAAQGWAHHALTCLTLQCLTPRMFLFPDACHLYSCITCLSDHCKSHRTPAAISSACTVSLTTSVLEASLIPPTSPTLATPAIPGAPFHRLATSLAYPLTPCASLTRCAPLTPCDPLTPPTLGLTVSALAIPAGVTGRAAAAFRRALKKLRRTCAQSSCNTPRVT